MEAQGVISIDQLRDFMRSGEPTILCDVRGPAAKGGFIPTSLRFDFASGPLPFELERGAAAGSVIVLYEGRGTTRAQAVRNGVFAGRGRVFVLGGGFASYLAAVTDPSTLLPFPGSVVDFVPGVPIADAPAESEPSDRLLHRISSTNSLDDEQTQAAAATVSAGADNAPIDDQVNMFVGGKASNSRRPEWTSDALVESCPFCSSRFSTVLRKHHCRACGQIYCFNCSRFFILLTPQYDYNDPERVCTACVRRCSNLDYAANFSTFTARSTVDGPRIKILMFGPEMQTRKPLEDLATALSEHHTVITFDLPGCGARDSEQLTEEACRRVVEESVEKHATGGAPVALCGIGMSAYVILKSVAAVKQRKVFGVILMGASKNYHQPSKLLLKGIGMLYKISPANRLWRHTVDELGGTQPILPKERFEELFLRNPVDYSKWHESVAVMCAPNADHYLKCIEQFRNPILFIPSGGKDDTNAFLAKAALGTVSTSAPHKHAYASPKFIPGIVAAIDNWIDTNKARLIIQDLDD